MKNVERVRKYQTNHKVHNVLLAYLYTPKNLRLEMRGNPFPFYMLLTRFPLDYFSPERLTLVYSIHSSLIPGCYVLSLNNPYRLLLQKILLLVYEVFENIAEMVEDPFWGKSMGVLVIE